MDGAGRTSIADLVRIADVAFDDVPACGEVDGAILAGHLIAREHGGGGGLLVAVGVDVADGLGVCPRPLRGGEECEGSDESADVVYHNNIMYNVYLLLFLSLSKEFRSWGVFLAEPLLCSLTP